jgi:hypothetical protein
MSCLFNEVKGNQKRNGYWNDTEMPQAGVAPKVALESSMGARTQMPFAPLDGQLLTVIPGIGGRQGFGGGGNDRTSEGSRLAARSALFTALVTFVAGELDPLQVAQ